MSDVPSIADFCSESIECFPVIIIIIIIIIIIRLNNYLQPVQTAKRNVTKP